MQVEGDEGQRFREDAERDATRQLELFQALSDAYGFVHAEENLRSTAARTVGDCLKDRINEIRGPHPQGLPALLDEVDSVKNAFDLAIQQLRLDAELTGEEDV